MNLKDIKDNAINAIVEACKITTSVQKDLVKEYVTVEKPDRSPVTIADLAAQALISLRLGNEIGLVAEETSEILQANQEMKQHVVRYVQSIKPDISEAKVLQAIDRGNHQGGNGTFWVLDPIDGTKGFLRHQQYAVCLALIEKGEIVFSVLGCPNYDASQEGKGSLFFAEKNKGTFMSSFDRSDEKQISVSDTQNPAEACFVESVESGHADHGLQKNIAGKLGITKASVRLDSQVKFAAIAKGDADIYLRFSPTEGYQQKIWDIAPGALLVEEAGGKITDINGDKLDYTKGRKILTANLFVTNTTLHNSVLKAIKDSDF